MDMKVNLSFRLFTILWVPVLLLSCSGEDDYYYPSVRQEFLTASSGSDGRLQTVMTDEGVTYNVAEDATKTSIDSNSTVRIVTNYGFVNPDDKNSGVKLYNLLKTVSPVPLPASGFKDGVKTDPASVLSIWMGLDYLNIILEIKAQDGRHYFHFIEDDVKDSADGVRDVFLRLYHDADGDVQAYTKRAYVSVPLRQYAVEGITKVEVHFSLNTYADGVKTYSFDYVPQ